MIKVESVKKEMLPKEEADAIQAEWDANAAEKLANEYKTKRKSEYPSVEDQLDMIYWDKVNNTNEWQDLIQSIKTKYPKP